jgi:hypothetical protein
MNSRIVSEYMYAIGSSYLIYQAPGAERIGGVTVKIRPRSSSHGSFEVTATDWRTEEPIEADVSFLAAAAADGVKKFAAENAIDLNEWDITVSRFAYHPVDYRVRTTETAAYNAAASAFASWWSARLRPSEE